MGKSSVKVLDLQSAGRIPALAVLSVFFVVGAVVGCLLAGKVGGGGSDALADYLQRYFAMIQSGAVSRPEVLPLIWEMFRWPLFAALLGLTALGVLGLPVLFAVRGFLLCFAVASFFRMFGGVGLLLAALAFGITSLITIPVLFILGVQGLLCAGMLADQLLGDGSGRGVRPGRAYLLRCCACCGALCVCVCVEYFALPALLQAVVELLA